MQIKTEKEGRKIRTNYHWCRPESWWFILKINENTENFWEMNNMRFSFKKRQNRRSLNMKLVLLEVSNFYYVIYLE